MMVIELDRAIEKTQRGGDPEPWPLDRRFLPARMAGGGATER